MPCCLDPSLEVPVVRVARGRDVAGQAVPAAPVVRWAGRWGTPLVIKVSDHQEVVTTFPYRLVAYEPSAGKELWFSKGVGDSFYASPLFGEGVVVGMSSGPEGSVAVAVKPDGSRGRDGEPACLAC